MCGRRFQSASMGCGASRDKHERKVTRKGEDETHTSRSNPLRARHCAVYTGGNYISIFFCVLEQKARCSRETTRTHPENVSKRHSGICRTSVKHVRAVCRMHTAQTISPTLQTLPPPLTLIQETLIAVFERCHIIAVNGYHQVKKQG